MNTPNFANKVSDLDADRLLTHGILNYISAAVQGQFAEYNTLSLLKSEKFSEDSLSNTTRGLDKITTWLTSAINGDCIFSTNSNEIETFDGQAALELAKKTRDHLIQSVERLSAFAKRTSMPEAKELIEIVALAANAAYSRDGYIRGFIEFGKRTDLVGMVQQYTPHLADSVFQVDAINDLIKRVRKDLDQNSAIGANLPAALYAVTRNTIVMLRSQLHDLRQIVARFEGEFNFDMAGFSKEEGMAWSEKNLGAVIAGYWAAFEFSAEQALRWIEIGINEPQFAATWRGTGFSVEETKVWASQGLNPFIASRFKSAGYSAEQTSASLERGEMSPVLKQQAA